MDLFRDEKISTNEKLSVSTSIAEYPNPNGNLNGDEDGSIINVDVNIRYVNCISIYICRIEMER